MIIQWVKDVMTVWGIQVRRRELGGRTHPTEPADGKADPFRDWHIDGYAQASVAGKAFDARGGDVGAGFDRKFPEGLLGDALKVSIALKGAPMHLQNIAFVHYVIPKDDAHVKQKANKLGYPDVRAYYRDMDKLHIWVEARWPDVPHGTKDAHDMRTSCA